MMKLFFGVIKKYWILVSLRGAQDLQFFEFLRRICRILVWSMNLLKCSQTALSLMGRLVSQDLPNQI